MISVLTTAYNEEAHIRKYFNSMLNQTYRDLEVIVVDDGSTDSTWDIIREYASKDARIKPIHQENQGLPVARNAAMKVMSGDYFVCIDADDWFELDCFEQAYQAAIANDADIVMWGYQKEFPDGRTEPQKSPPLAPGLYTGEECRQVWLDGICRMGRKIDAMVWLRLFRTSIVKAHDLWFDPTIKYYDDYYFDCRVQFYCTRIFSMGDRIYAHYRQHGASMMHTYFSGFFDTLLRTCDKLQKFYQANHAYTDEVQTRLNWAYLYLMMKGVRHERLHAVSDEEKMKAVDAMLNDPRVRNAVEQVGSEVGTKLFGERYALIRDKRAWELLNAPHL